MHRLERPLQRLHHIVWRPHLDVLSRSEMYLMISGFCRSFLAMNRVLGHFIGNRRSSVTETSKNIPVSGNT